MTDQETKQSSENAASDKQFPIWTTSVTRERQKRYHWGCDVATDVFGDLVDVSILSNDCGRSLVKAGLPLDGVVLTYHKIDQVKPVMIGDKLEIHGRIQGISRDRNGFILTTVFDFLRDGTRVVWMETIALPGEAQLMRKKRVGIEDKTECAGWPSEYDLVSRKLMTPEKARGYAAEVSNKIHFDPGFAANFGFRAPVTHRLMEVTSMLGVLAKKGLPDSNEIDCRFSLPLYWDDGMDVVAKDNGDALEFKCVNARGLLISEAEFRG